MTECQQPSVGQKGRFTIKQDQLLTLSSLSTCHCAVAPSGKDWAAEGNRLCHLNWTFSSMSTGECANNGQWEASGRKKVLVIMDTLLDFKAQWSSEEEDEASLGDKEPFSLKPSVPPSNFQ
ncbi:hypothetical protein P7K49_031573 [Saguinus oedipus]|uniref:Uncharacterized protein n=1 Tax=Saguinus oedipus TaxID=9490 RepID=A0ABQ9TZT1_SAGOE|nr:hypothetical protein P7K49_031573 [Saguinus oedipus]